MKILSIISAAACTLAFASAAPSFAQSTAPGAAPPTRTGPKAAPPPRPREIDKYATPTKPPGDPTPPGPKPVDDFATKRPGPQPLKLHCQTEEGCYWLDRLCTAKGGGMSRNPDGSGTCSIPD